MKKIISFVLSFCILTSALCFTVSGADLSTPVVEEIIPMYEYISSVSASVSSAGTNKVKYECKINSTASATKISAHLYLEEYDGDSWEVVDYVRQSTTSLSLKITDTYTSAIVGRKYRAKLRVWVYSGSDYELQEKISSTIVK